MSADRGAPLSPVATPEEAQFERQLRPRSFEEYVGQDQAVASLRVSVEAARQRGECVDRFCCRGISSSLNCGNGTLSMSSRQACSSWDSTSFSAIVDSLASGRAGCPHTIG